MIMSKTLKARYLIETSYDLALENSQVPILYTALGPEDPAKTIYAAVTASHRITIEQMGILEPALSETFAATLVTKMKEAVDIVVDKGVPKAAAYDFFMGHINIELAVVFGHLPGGQFSDAALKAIKLGEALIFKDNWMDIFEKDSVAKQIKAIT